MHQFVRARRTSALVTAAVALATLGSSLSAQAVASPQPRAGAQQQTDPSQPWRDTTKSPYERATLLLNALTFDEKVQVALDNLVPITKYGVPDILHSHDGPSGIGLAGTTAFPSAQTLAATFDVSLANQYGTAIAQELRGKGDSIWLGPATDVDRQPLAGRQAESLGEDPYLIQTIARSEVLGAKSQDTIQNIKHYGAYTQEYGRNGFEDATPGVYQGRSPAINEDISEQALHEIYESAVVGITADGGADSVMCSYNEVNGNPACQNADLLGAVKADWSGTLIPDFLLAQRDPVAAANAGVDLAGFDAGNQQRTAAMYTSGQIPLRVLNDSDHRVFFMLFDSGVFDNPPGTAQAIVSTLEHRTLAADVSAQGMVLLKNRGVLPLRSNTSVAVLGPSGEDAMYIEGGSPAVPTTVGTDVTPLAGITARAGSGATIVSSQGSAGDVFATTAIPSTDLAPGGVGTTGWTARYWNGASPQGPPAVIANVPAVQLTSPPTGVTPPFSAQYTSMLTPPETGLYRFTFTDAGNVTLTIGGRRVAIGMQATSQFFTGPSYPVQGTVNLTAGKPVSIRVDYSSTSALFGPSLALTWQTPSQSGIPAAVEAARHADTAIVMANFASGEGMDRTSLSLPGDQNQLIEAVAAVNHHTIVVLNTGGPVLMPWLNQVAGVVEAWYPGQMFGQSLASVLYGDVNPSGHLPVTFPANPEQGPVPAQPAALAGVDNTLDFKEGIYVGYRWYDETGQKPLFPFGYGLSYTSFEYSRLSTQRTPGGIAVTFTVRNTGAVSGTATPQIYVGAPDVRGIDFAKNALVGFGRVTLLAGQSQRVTIPVSVQQLRYWNEKTSSWVYALRGRSISVGDSVETLHLTEQNS